MAYDSLDCSDAAHRKARATVVMKACFGSLFSLTDVEAVHWMLMNGFANFSWVGEYGHPMIGEREGPTTISIRAGT